MKKWLLAICLTFFGLHAEEWVSEELYKDWKQVFKIENVLYQESTEFQNLILFQNVMWGSDYPHLEGTHGHTQETLHHLFDGVDAATRARITTGSFNELFPGVKQHSTMLA